MHKVLVAGSAAAKFQDCWITQGGGYLIHRSSPIAKGMAKTLDRLIKKYGEKHTIPIYEENGICNFSLKRMPQRAGGDAASSAAKNDNKVENNKNKVNKQVGQPGGPGFYRQPKA